MMINVRVVYFLGHPVAYNNTYPS